ncbi:MAG: DUF262 domain-containing protein [Gammaproteobacteria bacterium]|nr:DUF262 domain-containing protein [Gammaproteobacteria bacterium]
MNFNTSNSTFRQLLGNGLRYRVPPFQRDYSWTDDEWDDLWQDIVELFVEDAEPAHYMGYLVLQSANNKQFDIIDGQQRVTTLSILILASLAVLQDLINADIDPSNNQQRKAQLQNSYIGYLDPVSLIPQSKLELNRHNNNFYQTYLVPLDSIPQRGLKASEHQLRKAFAWFKDKIKQRVGTHDNAGAELAGFIDSIVDKLFFTVITVSDELNAFKVFETLNARGVRLSATDLLKNYLFSVVNSNTTHEQELKALEERWERIVGILGNESFSEFLRVYWNSQNRLVRKSDLFKTIRKQINQREQAFSLLRQLDANANFYTAFRDPHDTIWNQTEREALQQLMMFNVRQPMAMLMACYRAFFEDDRRSFTQVLNAVAIFSFRYNVICNLQANDQERLYNDIARKVTSGELSDAQSVVNALRPLYPDNTLFKGSFTEKSLRTSNSRSKKIARYILLTIERYRSGIDIDFESAKFTIEHILPEHPDDSWAHIEESKQERLIYRIGNLTPLEKSLNLKIGNTSYTLKREQYQNSQLQLSRAVAEHYDDWNEQTIDSRQKSLAKIAADIWRLAF